MKPAGGDVWGVVADDQAGKSPFAVEVSFGGKKIRTIRLETEVTYIGRMPENHVVLDDPRVSRSHARIMVQGGKLVVEDQQSENGIYVNGKKAAKQIIRIGDKITVGEHTLFVVPAAREAKTAVREDQLDQAEEEEWREAQTVSLSSDELQKIHLAKMKAKSEEQKNILTAPRSKAPQLTCVLQVGDKKLEKTVTFESGKKLAAKGTNALEIRLTLGEWVFEKKVTL